MPVIICKDAIDRISRQTIACVVTGKLTCCGIKSVQTIFGPDPNEMRGGYIDGSDTVVPQCTRIARVGFVNGEAVCHGIEVMETGLAGAKPQRSLLVFRNTDIDLFKAAFKIWLINMEILLIPVQ